MVELELAFLLVFASMWSILYEVLFRSRAFVERQALCSLAWVSWWVLSGFWLINTELYSPLAYLPLAVGWIYLIRLIIGIFDELRRRRWG